MKMKVKKGAVLLFSLLILCAGSIPANAAQATPFQVIGRCGLYNGTLLQIHVDYVDIGSVESGAFILRYNPDVIQISTEFIFMTNDHLVSLEIPVPGELQGQVAPSSPGGRYGRRGIVIQASIIGEGDFGLQVEGGEYTDLQGNKGVADARNRFVVNRTLKEMPTLPEDFNPAQLCCGDLNYDRSVTAEDARTILRAAVKLEELTPAQTLCADMDVDGRISAEDARTALRDAVGL